MHSTAPTSQGALTDLMQTQRCKHHWVLENGVSLEFLGSTVEKMVAVRGLPGCGWGGKVTVRGGCSIIWSVVVNPGY